MYKNILTILMCCILISIAACKTPIPNLTLESEMEKEKDFTPLNTSIYINPEIYDHLDDYSKASVISAKSMLENSLNLKDKKSVISQLLEISKLYEDASLIIKYEHSNKARKLTEFAKRSAELVKSGKKPLAAINNLSIDIRKQVKDVNNTLKQQIRIDDKVGVVKSLNQLVSLHQQKMPAVSSQTLRQECLSTINIYRDLATNVKLGEVHLPQLKEKVDKFDPTNSCSLK